MWICLHDLAPMRTVLPLRGDRHAITASEHGENVNPSEVRADGLLERAHVGIDSAIGRHTECLAPKTANRPSAVVDSSLVTSDDDNRNAVGGQSQSSRRADASRPSGHHRDFPCQIRIGCPCDLSRSDHRGHRVPPLPWSTAERSRYSFSVISSRAKRSARMPSAVLLGDQCPRRRPQTPNRTTSATTIQNRRTIVAKGTTSRLLPRCTSQTSGFIGTPESRSSRKLSPRPRRRIVHSPLTVYTM